MEPYIGEIRLFAGNYAPQGWNLCDGSIISIASYDTLFALIGTTYGGDGQTTFGLPDLRGRVVVGQQSSYPLGAKGGMESVTLTTNTIPGHNHSLNASTQPGNVVAATNNVLAAPVDPTPSNPQTVSFYMPSTAAGFAEHTLNPAVLLVNGSSQSHENRMPFVSITYIICMSGLYPSSS